MMSPTPSRGGRTRSHRALLINDDGVDSGGLHRLAEVALAAGLEVVVAAPLRESSGSSAGLTALEAHGRVVTEKRQVAGLAGVEVYGVAGSPGFIALIAVDGAFGPRPDIVLSGINNGLNTGQAILHSGTVGAAMTARAHGCRALAISAESSTETSESRWDTAAAVTARILPEVLRSDAPVVWNVNVPHCPVAELRGVRPAELASFGAVQTTIAKSGAGYLQVTVSDVTAEREPGSDAALVSDGYATVTALRPLCAATDSLPLLESKAAPSVGRGATSATV